LSDFSHILRNTKVKTEKLRRKKSGTRRFSSTKVTGPCVDLAGLPGAQYAECPNDTKAKCEKKKSKAHWLA
jgi:hypothetical protein